MCNINISTREDLISFITKHDLKAGLYNELVCVTSTDHVDDLESIRWLLDNYVTVSVGCMIGEFWVTRIFNKIDDGLFKLKSLLMFVPNSGLQASHSHEGWDDDMPISKLSEIYNRFSLNS